MKRGADTEKPGEPGAKNQSKRPKSSQACASCRKHKTRCELLDDLSVAPFRCHRCKVLNISCSFESSDFAPPLQDTPSAPPPRVSRGPDPASSAPGTYPRAVDTLPHCSETETTHIKPEDLIPLPPHAPWGYVKVPGGFDWTASPMLTMQKLVSRVQVGEDPSASNTNAALASIMSPERVKYLLNIYETSYSPWLNLQPHHAGSSNPVLVMARCLIASRHLDPVTRSAVVPQLQKLVDETMLRQVFIPTSSTEVIEAILILSLWAPLGLPPHAEFRDGRLMVASGVSMAMNMRLSQAVEYAAGLREDIKKGKALSDLELADLDDATEKARLWLALMNVESLLCAGTGRITLSHRTALDNTIIDSYSNHNIASVRDMRLSLMGQIFEITEWGLRLHLPHKSELDRFYKDVADVLMKYDNLLRLISPLPVVVEHEIFYFHILQIYHDSCRLLVLHHCLREVKSIVQEGLGSRWAELAVHNGMNLAMQWGHEALLLSEEILTLTLSRLEINQLSTAPDNIIALICFAASFLVICKLSIYQIHGEDLPGSSDTLLSKIINRLAQSACGPDHAPAKGAQLIASLVTRYKTETKKGKEIDRPKVPSLEHTLSSLRTSAATDEPVVSPTLPAEAQPYYEAPPFGSVDLSNMINSDVMLDSEFWSSFMDNLTADVPSSMEGARNG